MFPIHKSVLMMNCIKSALSFGRLEIHVIEDKIRLDSNVQVWYNDQNEFQPAFSELLKVIIT